PLTSSEPSTPVFAPAVGPSTPAEPPSPCTQQYVPFAIAIPAIHPYGLPTSRPVPRSFHFSDRRKNGGNVARLSLQIAVVGVAAGTVILSGWEQAAAAQVSLAGQSSDAGHGHAGPAGGCGRALPGSGYRRRSPCRARSLHRLRLCPVPGMPARGVDHRQQS